MKSRILAIGPFLAALVAISACQRTPQPVTSPPNASPASQSALTMLYQDDFDHGLDNWFIEREMGGEVTAQDGRLVIDVPAGCTAWFRPKLAGSIAIEYAATAIQTGGANDRVSDLNCFWMARDPKHEDDLFSHPRSGKFADYNTLLTYYVGLGGNGNTTTRFRRYIGEAIERPLLPEHDLRDPKFMLVPNVEYTIRLIADGNKIQYVRDGQQIFHLDDAKPYAEGWFGIRTTKSHLQIRRFRVYRIERSDIKARK
jgi:Domain of unknown function (DUF6250)